MESIIIRKAEPSDMEGAIALIGNQILSSPLFLQPARNAFLSLGTDGEAVLAVCDEKIVGAVIARKGLHYSNGKDNYFEQMKKDYPASEFWTLLDVAVDNDYQGRHIGSRLFRKMFEVLRSHGCGTVLMEIWIRANGYKPASNLIHLADSFHEYGVIDDFYQDDPFPCDFCKGECHCKALVGIAEI